MILAIVIMAICAAPTWAESDPLSSWNPCPTKTAILDFVARVTNPDSADFVPPSERIATFDNDGTLWCEKPVYSQLLFAIDRIHALAPQHPEWKEQEPYKSVLAGNVEAILAGGPKGSIELLTATHSGMTSEEFEKIVSDWIATNRHPRFNCSCTKLVYQPMIELLQFFRANGFKTYIVSGGGLDFMRPWAPDVYSIPREQIIGSTIRTAFEWRNGEPVIMRLPEIDFIDDKDGKPININKIIGHRPLAAFGNSDGDLQMLQWTAAGKGPRFMLIVHHTDADREWSYDRDSTVGKLDKALDEAKAKGWSIVDMKSDWKTVFSFEHR